MKVLCACSLTWADRSMHLSSIYRSIQCKACNKLHAMHSQSVAQTEMEGKALRETCSSTSLAAVSIRPPRAADDGARATALAEGSIAWWVPSKKTVRGGERSGTQCSGRWTSSCCQESDNHVKDLPTRLSPAWSFLEVTPRTALLGGSIQLLSELAPSNMPSARS
eukprot:6214700-Pleurochrysis_carterae.AAC.1